MLSKLSRLKIKNLRLFIDQFDSLPCEFVAVGGDRQNRTVYSIFLLRLPDKYSTHRSLYQGSTIDETMEDFRLIADKENFEANLKQPISTANDLPTTKLLN